VSASKENGNRQSRIVRRLAAAVQGQHQLRVSAFDACGNCWPQHCIRDKMTESEPGGRTMGPTMKDLGIDLLSDEQRWALKEIEASFGEDEYEALRMIR